MAPNDIGLPVCGREAREHVDERFGGRLEKSSSADRAAPQASSTSAVENFDFDYSSLDEEVSESVKQSADRIRSTMRRTVEDIIAIGHDLIAVKKHLGHGRFLKWIVAEFEMAERTARNFMHVAETYGKSATVADLSPRILYALAAPSTPPEVREQVEFRVQAGEKVTVEDVKALKDAWAQERKQPKHQITRAKDKAKNAEATKSGFGQQLIHLRQELTEVRNERDAARYELGQSAKADDEPTSPAPAPTARPANDRAVMAQRVEHTESLDFFVTPPWATRALIEKVFPHLGIYKHRLGEAWEPACGAGHMAEVLSEYFPAVVATDLFEYGYGEAGVDFLDINTTRDSNFIITNPPFGDKAERFVRRALDIAGDIVAVFVPLRWLETVGRYERLFRDSPPTLIAFFAERVNLCAGRWEPDGTTATAYVWLVWEKGRRPQPPFWIPPGQRASLERPDDRERFTVNPAIKRPAIVNEAAE